MASGYSKNPNLTGRRLNPRTNRAQELRQRFLTPSNRPAESQRDESRRGYQRPNTRSRDRGQASGSGQQGPGPSSQVQAMRQKFGPSKKQAESQKEESRRGSHGQGLAERGQESRGQVKEMRQKYEALEDGSSRQRGDRSREGSQGSGGQYPGPSQSKQRSYLDVPEHRDRPSFSKAFASTPQRGPGGATGGIQDQFRSAQDDYFEMWYHDNKETVKNHDFLSREIISIVSQYIPGIDAEEMLPSEVLLLARMLRDYIKELHEKITKVTRELENIKERIGAQDDSPHRSGFSSGNQHPNQTFTTSPGGRRTPSHRSHLIQEEHPSRAEPFRPVQELNRRWGPEDLNQRSETSGVLEQPPERQLHDLNRRWGPNDFMQQLQPPVQDFNRRWNLEDQFARMQSQQEYNADPEEEWDEGY